MTTDPTGDLPAFDELATDEDDEMKKKTTPKKSTGADRIWNDHIPPGGITITNPKKRAPKKKTTTK